MDVCKKIDYVLKKKGWTRYRLAKECNLPQSTLTNVFHRGTVPTIATLKIICNTLNITLSEFFAEGEMVELTPELKELFENWVFLTSNQKEAIILTMKSMTENKNKE